MTIEPISNAEFKHHHHHNNNNKKHIFVEFLIVGFYLVMLLQSKVYRIILDLF